MTNENSQQESTAATSVNDSPWTPFKHKTFTVIWLATLFSNIGTWMNDVGAGWLMTSLTDSPVMVSLVQTATTLPIFLFALPAGALADIVDKRKLLLIVQIIMTVLVTIFALLVWLELISPGLLLMFIFLLGSCAAFVAPAMQSIIPKLVPASELQSAIAIGGMGINISRAIGPALAGIIIVMFGIAAPFMLNALSFLAIIGAFLWWKSAPQQNTSLPAERMVEAITSGLRYTWASAAMKATLLRAFVFFFCASAFWTLIPLLARVTLNGDASLYGIMLAAIGIGAVTGAFFIPKIKKVLGPDKSVAFGTILLALVMLTSSLTTLSFIIVFACFAYGVGWITVLSTLNISAQLAVPDWVRARGISVYLTVFFGAMSLGSIVWGQVANISSISTALMASALLSILLILLTRKAKLLMGEKLNLSPSMHWPQPLVSKDVSHDQGPVMTTVEYRVPEVNRSIFLEAMHKLGKARKSSGAFSWDIMEDAENRGLFFEYFLEASWLSHLRHHERVSETDKALQRSIVEFLEPNTTIKISHLISGPK